MERIDIVITDKIQDGIDKKIAFIGKAALMANEELAKLQTTLNSIGVSKLSDVTRALGQLSVAHEKLQNVQKKGVLITQQLTNAQTANARSMQSIANGVAITTAKVASINNAAASRAALSAQQLSNSQTQGQISAARLLNTQAQYSTILANADNAQNRASISALKLSREQEKIEKSTTRVSKSWLGHIASVAGGIVLYQGLHTAIHGVVAMIEGGIRAVDDFQVSTIQMAAVLTSLAKDKTDISGNFQKALDYTKGLVPVLEEIDAKTTLSLDNLIAMTLEMNKQGVAMDTNNKEQIEGMTRMANAVALYSRNGEDMRQVHQEVRSLMNGEIREGNELAKLLDAKLGGQLKKNLALWKEQGTVIENLGRLLDGFGPATKELENTWGAVTSSLKTTFNIIARESMTEVLAEWVRYIKEFNSYLREHKEEIATKVVTAWHKLRDAIKWCYDNAELLKISIIAITSVSILRRIIEFVSAFIKLRAAIIGATEAVAALEFVMGGSTFLSGAMGRVAALTGQIGILSAAIAGLGYVGYQAGLELGKMGRKAAELNGIKITPLGGGRSQAEADDYYEQMNELRKQGKLTEATSTRGESYKVNLKSYFKPLPSTPPAMGNLPSIGKSQGSTGGRHGKSPEETRVDLLQKWNLEAQKELSTSLMLDRERTVEGKIMEHNNKLLEKKVKQLSPAEEEKLRSIYEQTRKNNDIRKEMDGVMEDLNGKTERHTAFLEALDILLKKNKITTEQFNQQLRKENEEFQNSIDPLRQINKELLDQRKLIGLVGDELELAAFRQQVENRLLSEGADLTTASTQAKINAIVKTKELNMALENQPRLWNDIKSGIKEWGSTMSTTLNDMLWGAKTTFGDILASFMKMITEIIIQTQVVKPFLSVIGLGGFSLGGVPAEAHADGGLPGSITPFAKGGVTNIPTIFPMARGGIGIMSEFGQDEAVMPLRRTPDGRLGVAATGKSEAPNVTVNITNNTGSAITQGETSSKFDGKDFVLTTVIQGVAENKNGMKESLKAMLR